ncbi:hypothetical protein ACP275_02G088300 [Erythranthe tilingii]
MSFGPIDCFQIVYLGTTKSHPPISEHLSREANDFWLKCLHKLIHPKLPCLIISLQEPYTFVFLWNEV